MIALLALFLWVMLAYGLPTGVLAYFLTRQFGWMGLFVVALIAPPVIFYVDVATVKHAMQQKDWNGVPDLDAIFMVGELFRVSTALGAAFLSAGLARFQKLREMAQVADHFPQPTEGG